MNGIINRDAFSVVLRFAVHGTKSTFASGYKNPNRSVQVVYPTGDWPSYGRGYNWRPSDANGQVSKLLRHQSFRQPFWKGVCIRVRSDQSESQRNWSWCCWFFRCLLSSDFIQKLHVHNFYHAHYIHWVVRSFIHFFLQDFLIDMAKCGGAVYKRLGKFQFFVRSQLCIGQVQQVKVRWRQWHGEIDKRLFYDAWHRERWLG